MTLQNLQTKSMVFGKIDLLLEDGSSLVFVQLVKDIIANARLLFPSLIQHNICGDTIMSSKGKLLLVRCVIGGRHTTNIQLTFSSQFRHNR